MMEISTEDDIIREQIDTGFKFNASEHNSNKIEELEDKIKKMENNNGFNTTE